MDSSVMNSFRSHRPTLRRGGLFVLSLGLAVLAAAGTGCTGNRAPRGGPNQARAASARAESELRARAEGLWTALVNADWTSRYTYEESGVREGVKLEDYVKWHEEKEPFKYVSFEIYGVEVDGDAGWVDMRRTLAVRKGNFGGSEMRVWDKWRHTDGAWCQVPKTEMDFYPAAPSVRDAEGEKALKKRFLEAWELRKSGNCDDLFAMLDPRDIVGRPQDEFCKLIFEHSYLQYEIAWVEVIGTSGKVRAAYKVKVNDANSQDMPARVDVHTEKWVFHDGQWWVDVVLN